MGFTPFRWLGGKGSKGGKKNVGPKRDRPKNKTKLRKSAVNDLSHSLNLLTLPYPLSKQIIYMDMEIIISI
jgi:hypothetical protein